MAYQRILTIQDISCVGQCSLTVALPILSACGHETAALPTAVLSTHTGRFQGYTFRDLTDDIPGICAHWTGLFGGLHRLSRLRAADRARAGRDPVAAAAGRRFDRRPGDGR